MTCDSAAAPEFQTGPSSSFQIGSMRDAESFFFDGGKGQMLERAMPLLDFSLDALFHRLQNEFVNLQAEPHVEAIGEYPFH